MRDSQCAVIAAHVHLTDPLLTQPVRHIASIIAQGGIVGDGDATVGPYRTAVDSPPRSYAVGIGNGHTVFSADAVPCMAAAQVFCATVGVIRARHALVRLLTPHLPCGKEFLYGYG